MTAGGSRPCLSQVRPRAASRRWRSSWPRLSAARSSTPIRCRSTGTFASSPPAPSAGDLARAPHHLYGHVDGARATTRSGRWREDARPRPRRRRASAAAADLRRRHGPLLQGAGAGPRRRCLRFPKRSATRPRAHGGAVATADLHARLAAADAATAAGCAQRPPAHPAGAGGLGGDRPAARRHGRASRTRLPYRRRAQPAAVSRTGSRRALWPHRRALPCHGRRGRARRGRGPRRPAARSGPAGDARPWRTLADPPSARGQIGLDEAVARAQADTRHYAKRQFTWFRHQSRRLDVRSARDERLGARDRAAGLRTRSR